MIILIIRLFFIISAVFLLLVCGLAAALFLKMRMSMPQALMPEENEPRKQHHKNDKVIEGEYKIIDESHTE